LLSPLSYCIYFILFFTCELLEKVAVALVAALETACEGRKIKKKIGGKKLVVALVTALETA
jgi:hypothetical protein